MKILETFSGLNYEVTQEQADNITAQSFAGRTKGIQLGNDYISFASIKSIADLVDMHQPYSAPQIGVGFSGVINRAKKLSALQALARGLNKAKAQLVAAGQTTRQIDSLLDLARKRYAAAKQLGDN